MKNTLLILLSMIVFVPGGASSGEASPTPLAGAASFGTKERTYLGSYAATNRSISVEIDGVAYKGHYAPLAEDTTAPSSGVKVGNWGRALLFASSAKILHCQLDAGFPKISGQCQDANGRTFQLAPGIAQQKVAAP